MKNDTFKFLVSYKLSSEGQALSLWVNSENVETRIRSFIGLWRFYKCGAGREESSFL